MWYISKFLWDHSFKKNVVIFEEVIQLTRSISLASNPIHSNQRINVAEDRLSKIVRKFIGKREKLISIAITLLQIGKLQIHIVILKQGIGCRKPLTNVTFAMLSQSSLPFLSPTWFGSMSLTTSVDSWFCYIAWLRNIKSYAFASK